MAITQNHYSPYTGTDVDKAVSAIESIQDLATVKTITVSGGLVYVSGSHIAYYSDINAIITSGGYTNSAVVSQIASSVASGTISGAIISGNPINTVIVGELCSGAVVAKYNEISFTVDPARDDATSIRVTVSGAYLTYGDSTLAVASGGVTVNGEEVATKSYAEDVASASATAIANETVIGALVDYPTSGEATDIASGLISEALSAYPTSGDAQDLIDSTLTGYPTSGAAMTMASGIVNSALTAYPNSGAATAIASGIVSSALTAYPSSNAAAAIASGIVNSALQFYPTSQAAVVIATNVTSDALRGYPNWIGVSGVVQAMMGNYPTSAQADVIASGVVNDKLTDYPTRADLALTLEHYPTWNTASSMISSSLTPYLTSSAGVNVASAVAAPVASAAASAAVDAVLDDALASALVNYPTSAEASTIASYTTELALASGGYAKAADISTAITTSAIPKNTPFVTVVSGCTLTLSGGGFTATMSGHTFQLTSGGVVADGSAITQTSVGFTETSLSLPVVSGGTKYICSSALAVLSVGSVMQGCNTTIMFTVADGAMITPPSNVPLFGVTMYIPGSSYMLMMNGDAAVCNMVQVGAQ